MEGTERVRRGNSLLLAYQLTTGLSDTATGILLVFAPAFTVRWMRLSPPPGSFPLFSLIGAFVFSVGIACFYGGAVVTRAGAVARIETVWLLTAITRGAVALLIAWSVISGKLEPGWITVALFDGICAALQAIGLGKGWLKRAAA